MSLRGRQFPMKLQNVWEETSPKQATLSHLSKSWKYNSPSNRTNFEKVHCMPYLVRIRRINLIRIKRIGLFPVYNMVMRYCPPRRRPRFRHMPVCRLWQRQRLIHFQSSIVLNSPPCLDQPAGGLKIEDRERNIITIANLKNAVTNTLLYISS